MVAIHHNTIKKAKSHKIDLVMEDGEVVASQNGVRLASHLSGTVALEKAIWAASTKQTDPSAARKAAHKAASTANLGAGTAAEYAEEVEAGQHDAAFEQPKKTRKQPKAAAPKKLAKAPKSSGPHEDAARAEGWKPVKAGGYKQDGVDDEDGGTSEAASWRDLCDEQDIEVESDGRSIIKAKYRQIYRPHRNTNGDDLAQRLRDYLVYDDEGEERIDADKLARFARANECWVESYASLANVGMVRMNCSNRLRAKLRKDPEYKIKWVK